MKTDLLVENEAAQRSGGVWDYISPSRLNCWLSCPLKFKLRYIDGVRTPTTPALFVGKRTHDGLEVYFRHRMLGITLEPGDVAERMVASWDQAVAEEEMTFDSTDAESAIKKQSVDLVVAYLEQARDDEAAPLAVEAKLEAPLIDPVTGEDLGVPLLGVVDLILPDESGPVICDFKTSSRSSPPFEVSHEIQLSSYSYLYGQVTGDREAALEIHSLVKTKTPKIECHRYPARSEKHFRRLFAVVREYLDALDIGRFNYRPGWGCGMCDHRDSHCREWCG